MLQRRAADFYRQLESGKKLMHSLIPILLLTRVDKVMARSPYSQPHLEIFFCPTVSWTSAPGRSLLRCGSVAKIAHLSYASLRHSDLSVINDDNAAAVRCPNHRETASAERYSRRLSIPSRSLSAEENKVGDRLGIGDNRSPLGIDGDFLGILEGSPSSLMLAFPSCRFATPSGLKCSYCNLT